MEDHIRLVRYSHGGSGSTNAIAFLCLFVTPRPQLKSWGGQPGGLVQGGEYTRLSDVGYRRHAVSGGANTGGVRANRRACAVGEIESVEGGGEGRLSPPCRKEESLVELGGRLGLREQQGVEAVRASVFPHVFFVCVRRSRPEGLFLLQIG